MKTRIALLALSLSALTVYSCSSPLGFLGHDSSDNGNSSAPPSTTPSSTPSNSANGQSHKGWIEGLDVEAKPRIHVQFKENISNAEINPDDSSMLVVENGVVHFYDLATGSETKTLKNEDGKEIYGAIYSPSGATMITYDESGTMTLRDSKQLKVLQTFDDCYSKNEGGGIVAHFSDESSFAAFCSIKYSIFFFQKNEMGKFEKTRIIANFSASESHMNFNSRNTQVLAFDILEFRWTMYDITTEANNRIVKVPAEKTTGGDANAISADDRYLIASEITIEDNDINFVLFDLTGEKDKRGYTTALRKREAGQRIVSPENIAFHPNGTQIVTDDDSGYALWDIASGNVVKFYHPSQSDLGDPHAIRLTKNGKSILRAHRDFFEVYDF